jgi:hypothetical protein
VERGSAHDESRAAGGDQIALVIRDLNLGKARDR